MSVRPFISDQFAAIYRLYHLAGGPSAARWIYSRNWFGIYWATIPLFILLFMYPTDHLGPRDYKNHMFLYAALFSLLAFRTRHHWVSLLSVPLLFIGLFTQHTFMAATPTRHFLFLTVSLLLLAQLIHNWSPSTRRLIYRGFAIGHVLACAWVFAEWMNYDPYKWFWHGLRSWGFDPYPGAPLIRIDPVSRLEYARIPVAGPLGHWMVTASYLGATVPFLPWFLWPLTLATAWVLPSGLLPVLLVVAVGVWALYRYSTTRFRWALVMTPLLAGLFIYLFPHSDLATRIQALLEPSERLQIWRQAWDLYDHRWIGHGLGVFRDSFYWTTKGTFLEVHMHPHNELVLIYSSFGFLGLLTVFALIIYALRRCRTDLQASLSLIILLVACLGAFPLFISSTAFIVLVALAALLGHNNRIN